MADNFYRSYKNHKNYIISLANFCRWLAEQAEKLGVEIFPGFPASEVLYNNDGSVKMGVATLDMGLDKEGNKKDTYQEGYCTCKSNSFF